jgi:hypothetical protein
LNPTPSTVASALAVERDPATLAHVVGRRPPLERPLELGAILHPERASRRPVRFARVGPSEERRRELPPLACLRRAPGSQEDVLQQILVDFLAVARRDLRALRHPRHFAQENPGSVCAAYRNDPGPFERQIDPDRINLRVAVAHLRGIYIERERKTRWTRRGLGRLGRRVMRSLQLRGKGGVRGIEHAGMALTEVVGRRFDVAERPFAPLGRTRVGRLCARRDRTCREQDCGYVPNQLSHGTSPVTAKEKWASGASIPAIEHVGYICSRSSIKSRQASTSGFRL